MKTVRHAISFVILYVLMMVPTYILPYFGSNSAITNTFSSAMGLGFTPQWWMHAWSIAIIILLAWMRGKWIDKGYLPAFSIAAGIFDLTPILSSIPLIPTAFHLLAIVLGAMGKEISHDDTDIKKSGKFALTASLIVTGIAVLGIAVFITTASRIATTKTVTNPAPRIEQKEPSKTFLKDDVNESVVNKDDDNVIGNKEKTSRKEFKSDSNPFEEGQNWSGSYKCLQEITPLKLKITKVSKSSDGQSYEINAIFDFGDESHIAGSYNMTGKYETASRKAAFRPLDWIQQPPEYTAVGMSGKVSNGNKYNGKIDHTSCSNFNLNK